MIGETELTDGMEIETSDGVLKFKDGNLVNDKGEVFKKADEIKDYLAQFNSEKLLSLLKRKPRRITYLRGFRLVAEGRNIVYLKFCSGILQKRTVI